MGYWIVALLGVVLCGSGCRSAAAPPPDASGEVAIDADGVSRFTADVIESSSLVYVSDYFSFVGQDAQGRMALALDNNRGRDADAYQAEHIVFLHDEKEGWIDVPGFARYENTSQELQKIPDSPYFTFEGDPAGGLTVRSTQAPLELLLSPLPLKVIRAGPDRVFAMASAPAVLKWQDRTLKGRVIYEYLVANNQNRLSRGFGVRQFVSPISFQGLYLKTGEQHDLYLHRARLGSLDPTGENARLGFYEEDGNTDEAQDLELNVFSTSQGPGLFRWPQSWRANWHTPNHGKGRLEAEVIDFKRVKTLVFGGYAMAIVKGILEQDGKKIPVYGLGELIQWL